MMGMQGVDSEKAYQNWTLEVENEISTPLFKQVKLRLQRPAAR